VARNPSTAVPTEQVTHRVRPKGIALQCPFAFLNNEAVRGGADPLVALLGADTAIAFHDRSQLGDLDVELEGPCCDRLRVSIASPSRFWEFSLFGAA